MFGWVLEMWGYAIAAASLGIRHTVLKDGREVADYDAIVAMRDLVDSYLYPFQQCVEKGQAAGLMCSCAQPSLSLLATVLVPYACRHCCGGG